MDRLFAEMTHTPQQHFALYFYAALLRVIEQASLHFGSADAANERLPFLGAYFDEMSNRGLSGSSFGEAHQQWRSGIEAWEQGAPSRLPLAALRSSGGLTTDDVILLVEIALPDEDPRLGLVFDALQAGLGDRRPTLGILAGGWQSDAGMDVRASAHRLQALGLIEIVDPHCSTLRTCPLVSDTMRGSVVTATTGWAHYRHPGELADLGAMVLPANLRADCLKLSRVLERRAAAAIVLRGPRHNGRRTLAGAIACAIGKGMVEVTDLEGPKDPRWRTAAALACLLDAVLFVSIEPGPSESWEFPNVPDGMAPLFVALGAAGGLTGDLADSAVTLRVPVPDAEARGRLWCNALGAEAPALAHLRMTSGHITRAARIARAGQAVTGDGCPDTAALRAAVSTLDRPGLEALAQRVDASGDWSLLAVSGETLTELQTLGARCRQRERLGAFVGQALGAVGPGVRALFKGPSGTGKTLAARLLAGTLGMDLYRLDLSAVVNKYIGETEKNLERVFARAEELDVILLLDEGDALLTQRTGVQSANDRYANLETNYLLQRLESYEGILIVTTNAADRIDSAFQRRMDVMIDFSLPDASERFAIWQLHLPRGHEVHLDLLHAAVQRCALSGAQIRNVALHASLLAVENGSRLRSDHFEAAVEREYRKQGAVSPLRIRTGAR